MFAPVSTIVLYAVVAMLRGDSLDASTAFPTIALIASITRPANMIMTIAPRAVISYASVERIEAYLSSEETKDRAEAVSRHHEAGPAISIRDLTISVNPDNRKILDGLNLDISSGSITILSGASRWRQNDSRACYSRRNATHCRYDYSVYDTLSLLFAAAMASRRIDKISYLWSEQQGERR